MLTKITFLIYLMFVSYGLSSNLIGFDRSSILGVDVIYSKTYQIISNDSLKYEYLLTISDKSRSIDGIYNHINNAEVDSGGVLIPLCGCSDNISFYEISLKLNSGENVKIDINKCGGGFETGYLKFGNKNFKIKFSKKSEKRIKEMFSEIIKKKSEKIDFNTSCN